MAREVTDVERALLALDPVERAAVIERGLLSLEDGDPADQADIDAAWLTEVNCRVDEYLSGDATLVDADKHHAQIRAKLAPRDV